VSFSKGNVYQDDYIDKINQDDYIAAFELTYNPYQGGKISV